MRRVVLACVTLSSVHQSKQWVMGQWVKWVSFFGWVIWVVGRCTFTHDPPAYETEPLPCQTATDVFDPFYWWEQHEQSYPILSGCARRLLVIPVSSAECERHLSAFNARHIITSQRNLLFLKLWRLCQLC